MCKPDVNQYYIVYRRGYTTMKLIANGRVLDLSTTQVMGILNITPDSFFDGGQNNTLSAAIDHTSKMITYGATLIDIGGESTRPGSIGISDEEELERVIPVIHEISKRFDIFISVNTSSALVIDESAIIGAHLINDVRSLHSDSSFKSAKQSNLAICLTHMQGTPKTMQDNPVYSNVVGEINDFFHKQINRCVLSGIDKNRLLLDPGFGFGKTIEHNYQLLSNLRHFHHFNLPLLIGISRKSMLNYRCRSTPKHRLIGSITCAIIAAMQGVHILRVHDVKETVEALYFIKTMHDINKYKESYESPEILRN